MPVSNSRPPLVLLIGPTAVGKTAASLDLAMRINAEIISADSRLFYRGMDIGTAKPSPAEQAAVPHHLIDFLTPDQPYSLGEFQQAVYRIAAGIHARGRIPLMVGGTGQYIRAITEGWIIPAKQPNPDLRAALEAVAADIGTEGLHRWLDVLDPAAAGQIDHRNARRTIRALEVIFSTGSAFSSQRRKGDAHFQTLIIGFDRPRDELYARIDARIDDMFARGFVLEVESLLAQGFSPELPSMTAIGYQEVCLHLEGRIPLDEAVRRMKKRTRAFVRRQANWFKKDDPAIRWFTPDGGVNDQIYEYLVDSLRFQT